MTAGRDRLGVALALAYAVWLCNGFYVQSAAKAGMAVFWTLDLLQWIVLPVILWCAFLRPAGISAGDIGFAAPKSHWMKLIGETIGVFLTAGTLFFLVRAIAEDYFPASPFNVAQAFPAQGPLRTLAWIYSSVTAGVVESALFIGAPWLWWQAHTRGLPRWVFVLLISALFAVSHWELGIRLILAAFVTHWVACLWYFRLRNLWAIAGAHTIVDLIAFG